MKTLHELNLKKGPSCFITRTKCPNKSNCEKKLQFCWACFPHFYLIWKSSFHDAAAWRLHILTFCFDVPTQWFPNFFKLLTTKNIISSYRPQNCAADHLRPHWTNKMILWVILKIVLGPKSFNTDQMKDFGGPNIVCGLWETLF